MGWPTIFASLGGGNQALSLIDAMFQQVAAMVAIPCTATNANSIALAPIGNAPSSTNLGSYNNFNTFSFIAAGTSTLSVTAQFGSLAALPVYKSDGITQAGAGDLVSGRPYFVMYSAALNSGGGGFYLRGGALTPSGGQATQQVFLSGSGTYTTPANCLQLRIRMVGGGGGGAAFSGGGGGGSTGGNTTFNAVTANAGVGGGIGISAGGAGGTGGAGAATVRLPGSPGMGSSNGATNPGGIGGAGSIGSAGAGGAGSASGSASLSGAGGGSGEYCELVINNPVATYSYSVGAGGAGAGTGAAGQSGLIYVEERYQD